MPPPAPGGSSKLSPALGSQESGETPLHPLCGQRGHSRMLPPALTSAFLCGLPSAVTETERAMGLAGHALLGRRDTGAGRPVRVRSAAAEPAPGQEEPLRVLFMAERRGLEGRGVMGSAPSKPHAPLLAFSCKHQHTES